MCKNEANTNSMYYIKSVNELNKGDIILHPIYRQDGLLISNELTKLTDYTIRQIKAHLNPTTPNIILKENNTIDAFLVEEEYTEDIFIKNVLKIIEKSQNTNVSKLFLNAYINYRSKDEIQSKVVDILIDMPFWNFFEERFESQRLRNRTSDVKKKILEVFSSPYMVDLAERVYNYDEQIMIQGINTLCMALFIGLTVELTDESLVELAVASFMCNVGFIKTNKQVFRAFIHGEYYQSIVNEHINIALDLFEESPFAGNRKILYGILEHHEYYNGNGLPTGKKGKDLSLFGRILMIVHDYDDMVSGCYDKEVLNTNQVESFIWRNEEKKYDSDIIKLFIHRTNILKIGCEFINTHNEKGIIVGFRNYIEEPLKPIVQFEDGRIIDYYVD